MENYLSHPVICGTFTDKALKNKETLPFFEIWALKEQSLVLVI
jgi:hypothetical protein